MEGVASMIKNDNINLIPNRTFPIHFGVVCSGNSIEFAVKMEGGRCGIILYFEDDIKRIEFDVNCKLGKVYSGIIKGVDIDSVIGYNFYQDDKEFVDPYVRRVIGNEVFGASLSSGDINNRSGAIVTRGFDWEDEAKPNIPYEKSIYYMLHVRGFTMDKSSKVKANGTFRGIIEKLQYLKSLGITSVELMPCYEFEEVDVFDESAIMKYSVMHYREKIGDNSLQNTSAKLNTWGYKEAHYFAPKASYSFDDDCVSEMKELVKRLHQSGIEIIMQFYFSNSMPYKNMYDILAFWLVEYHIDGFHLLGENLPVNLIAREALFSDTKILYERFDNNFFSCEGYDEYANLATYNNDFMNGTRRYLKGDQDSIAAFSTVMKQNNNFISNINYISNYNEFTLYDLVSYDYKHNNDNGEDNKDGNNYNNSWNHGVEGETKKRSVIQLRRKQMKNIMTYLLLAQGTPMIVAGDEFGNTRFGNNNAYCHDDEYWWLDWKLLNKNKQVNNYIKDIIGFRKEHSIFHPKTNFKMVDILGCGHPDLSYHGEEVWKPNFENYSRLIALLYSGEYGTMIDGVKQSDYYVIYNSHWVMHNCNLPRLRNGYSWKKIFDTNINSDCIDELLEDQERIRVSERSVMILEASKEIKKKTDKVSK